MPRVKQKHTFIASLEAKLLKHLRARGGMSRVELARKLHLAPSTVGIYVDRLINEGFIVEYEKSEREIGRPPTLLAPSPLGGQFVGVDFEARNLMAVAVDFSQKPIKQIHRTIRPSDSVERILAQIEQAIEEVKNDDSRKVLGIGVGVPGIVDRTKQVVLRYEHIPGWENVPVVERLRNRFQVDVYLENNIRSMALAELWFGQGRGLDDFVCVGVRTGIAAGVIAGGQLLHGNNNLAGEIGLWSCPLAPIELGASGVWACDKLKVLEEIAAIPAILKAVDAAMAESGRRDLRADNGTLTFDAVAEAAHRGDAVVREVLDRVAQTLGWVLCQINSLINPQRIILAGPLVRLGDAFLAPLRSAVSRYCAALQEPPPVIVDSELGRFSGALGAAALALHEWKPIRGRVRRTG